MKYTFACLALSGLVLAACGGAGGDSAVQADCKILAADPEALENFGEMGTDAKGFCDCFVKVVASKPEEDQTKMKVALEKVTDGMEESGEGAEEVVGELIRGGMMSPGSEEVDNLLQGINLIGQAIDDIGNGFEDNGSCPVS